MTRSDGFRGFITTMLFGAVALAAVVAGSEYGNVHGSSLHTKVTAWAGAAVFVVGGVIALRRGAALIGHVVAQRTIASAGVAVRLLFSIAGYVIVLSVALGVLDVSIEHLLVGGALTGVVLGIAAQQSLGNVFAGLVILFAHPFSIGDHIRLRSGQLGGELDGIVLSMSLTYVTLHSSGGPLKVPNSTLLAAAVGPYIRKSAQSDALTTLPVPAADNSDGVPDKA